MNTLVNTNDILIKFRLRRVVEYWGLKSDDGKYIYYMLAPHWVRHKKPILYPQNPINRDEYIATKNAFRLHQYHSPVDQSETKLNVMQKFIGRQFIFCVN